MHVLCNTLDLDSRLSCATVQLVIPCDMLFADPSQDATLAAKTDAIDSPPSHQVPEAEQVSCHQLLVSMHANATLRRVH